MSEREGGVTSVSVCACWGGGRGIITEPVGGKARPALGPFVFVIFLLRFPRGGKNSMEGTRPCGNNVAQRKFHGSNLGSSPC